MNQKRVSFLVVDSGAFLKNAPVHEFADDIFTIKEVVQEIKDKATKLRLQVLPYDLKFRQPPQEVIKYVTEFSKKTGDYPSLSATDILVLSLTYQLEKEKVGTEHLNREPSSGKVSSARAKELTALAGFYSPYQEQMSIENINSDEKKENSENEKINIKHLKDEILINDQHNNSCGDTDIVHNSNNCETDLEQDVCLNQNSLAEKNSGRSTPNESKSDSDEQDDDDGWITPSNIAEVKKKMLALSMKDSAPVTVACVTTDFAMQNMLLQLGLHVLSVDGMLIQHLKVFIFRCYSCFRTTSVMTKQFCSYCGNKTLKRVAVTVDENGDKQVHINFKRPINIKGTKYSLPVPKGGKHANNPILCEDQPIPHNRPAKIALKKIDVFDPDYVVCSSPFAVNDIYSRAANLGIRGKNPMINRRRNPNENAKRTGNKRK